MSKGTCKLKLLAASTRWGLRRKLEKLKILFAAAIPTSHGYLLALLLRLNDGRGAVSIRCTVGTAAAAETAVAAG